jgi:DNA-binding CsgD family transcriptional regulator
MIRLTGDDHQLTPSARDDWGGSPDGPEFDLMDAFSAALLLVDEKLQVLRSNSAANEQLEPDGGSFARLLGRSTSGPSQEARRHIRDSIVRGVRGAFLLGSSGSDALICSVVPLRRGPPARALVVLMPLAGGTPKVVAHLRALYRLSNAEAEIAASAATGMDVVQMAAARAVSIHTLRAQIAAIKAKMGLSRMTEIAVTVGRIDAAITWL